MLLLATFWSWVFTDSGLLCSRKFSSSAAMWHLEAANWKTLLREEGKSPSEIEVSETCGFVSLYLLRRLNHIIGDGLVNGKRIEFSLPEERMRL